MTDLRTAAKQALEAMNYTGMDVGKFNRINAACAALNAALKQPEQEPVAWMDNVIDRVYTPEELDGESTASMIPLYTQPPRREWRGLTDEEISEIFEAKPRYHYPPICETDREFARAIEAALKEKNR